MNNKTFGTAAVITTVLSLSGCSTNPALVKGESGSYRTGFAHGCDSRAVDNNPFYFYQRVINKYWGDADYTKGWDSGYEQCSKKGTLESIFTHEEGFLHDAIEEALP